MKAIKGAFGGGGGGGGTEAPNTLRASTTLKVLDALCEGPVEGLIGGAKGIYLDWTQLQASNDEYNFPRVAWDFRSGLPVQDYIPGYPSASSPVGINTVVTTTTPVVRTSPSTADSSDVTINTPQGMLEFDGGDQKGSSVTYTIETKLTSSGTWANLQTFTIEGKTGNPYERTHSIPRPAGTGDWDIRVSRVTPDATTNSVRNQISWLRRTDKAEIQEEYENTVITAMSVDAEAMGGRIPLRGYLLKGLIVKIPSNFNGETRVYTGTWDGTFTTGWTDCPAWCLYDLITNARYGAGEFITESLVDKYSFYDASVYCAEQVDDGNGGTEPRFSLNCIIKDRDEAQKWFATLAGTMRSNLIWVDGLLTVVQDRPEDAVKLITKANVIDGLFEYSGTSIFNRHTAYNVTWNDRADRHFQKVTSLDATTAADIAPSYVTALSSAQDRYGYVPADIAAYGATTQGQAIRHALWALDTELTQTDAVRFKMSLNGFALRPGDIVNIYQEDYAEVAGSGRIVSGSGTSYVLDRAVTHGGANELSVLLADGVTIETRAVTGGSGVNVTIASPFSQSVPAGADFHFITTVEARPFKIISIKEDENLTVAVEALFHDPAKYDRVEEGIFIPPPTYTNTVSGTVGPPSNLVITELGRPADNSVYRNLLLSWDPPTVGVAAYYTIHYRKDGGNWEIATPIRSPVLEVPNLAPGTYDLKIYSVSIQGNQSATSLDDTYTIDVAGGSSDLEAPTNLQHDITASTTAFEGNEIPLRWTNPATQADMLTAALMDFEVRVIDPDDDTILRTAYFPAVAAGAVQRGIYDYASNVADGGPRRSVKFEVRCRDTNYKLSAPATVTMTNPAPAVPDNITTFAIPEGIALSYDPVSDADKAGYVVWADTTPGFTPSASNRLVLGNVTQHTFTALPASTTYYFRVAAYDTFTSDAALETGTGLNLSVEDSVTTLSATSSTNTGYVVAYKRSATAPTDNPGDVTFTFGTGITTPATDALANGWTKTIPASDGNPLYIIGAVAGGTGATDTVLAAEWDDPILMVNDGLDGINYTTVHLYRRTATNSAPSLTGTTPANDLTYTFSTGAMTGTPPSGWSLTIPGSGGAYLWRVDALASSSTATDVIPYTRWSTPYLFASDGANAVSYWLQTSAAAVQKSLSNVFTPTTLSVTGRTSSGSSVSNYAGRFIIATSTDGSSWTDRYTSASNESSYVWTITPSSTNFIRVRLYEAGGVTNLLDEEIVPTVSEGAVGADGKAAITVVVQNDKVTLPADSAGTVSSYSNSGASISVYEGGTALIYNSSIPVGAPGKFTVGTPTVTNGTITVPSPSYSGLSTNTATVGNSSSMTTDTATIRWPITIYRLDGSIDSVTYYATQSVGKAKQGATGSTGSTGNTGDSVRYAYALFTGSPGSVTWDVGSTRTVSGDTLPGSSTVSNPDAASIWTATPPTPSAGQSVWVAFGKYRIATNDTVWDSPILNTLRVNQLSAITADMGTLTAGTIDTSGWIRAQGNTSLSVPFFGGSVTRTAAVISNTSLGAQVGLYGNSTSTSGFGVMGANATGYSGGSYGVGVYGEGGIGVQGYALNTSSIGVFGTMGSSLTIGKAGYFGLNGNSNSGAIGVEIDASNQNQKALTTQGGKIEFNGDGSTQEMRLKTSVRGSSVGYGVMHAMSSTNYQINLTSSGNAGGSASVTSLDITMSTGNVAVRGLSLTNMTVGTGAATATFSGTNKPGANTSNTWVTMVINGTTYYIPAWT